MIFLLLKAFFVGFVLAIPTGPVGILVIRGTLEQSKKAGMLLGVGSVFADMVYAFLAVSSLVFVQSFLDMYKLWFSIFAILLLTGMGFSIVLKKKKSLNTTASIQTVVRNLFTGFLLTITNPSVILSFLLAFKYIGLDVNGFSFFAKIVVVFGVMFGAVTWWTCLTGFTHLYRHKVSATILKILDRVSAGLLLGFATFVLIHDIVLPFLMK